MISLSPKLTKKLPVPNCVKGGEETEEIVKVKEKLKPVPNKSETPSKTNPKSMKMKV